MLLPKNNKNMQTYLLILFLYVTYFLLILYCNYYTDYSNYNILYSRDVNENTDFISNIKYIIYRYFSVSQRYLTILNNIIHFI